MGKKNAGDITPHAKMLAEIVIEELKARGWKCSMCEREICASNSVQLTKTGKELTRMTYSCRQCGWAVSIESERDPPPFFVF